MTQISVVDASAIAALLFGEPDAERVANTINNSTLIAPVLLRFEVASVCLKKIQLHPKQRVPLLEACALMNNMGIEFTEIVVNETIVLAEKHALSVYDAAYLWLTKAFNAELISLDKKLLRAARSV